MSWRKLTFRHEEPCDQVKEDFIVRDIPEPELVDCLNRLHLAGFQDVTYDENGGDIDTSYQKKTYTVEAWRFICLCKKK